MRKMTLIEKKEAIEKREGCYHMLVLTFLMGKAV
jgi:hypothetical protein